MRCGPLLDDLQQSPRRELEILILGELVGVRKKHSPVRPHDSLDDQRQILNSPDILLLLAASDVLPEVLSRADRLRAQSTK